MHRQNVASPDVPLLHCGQSPLQFYMFSSWSNALVLFVFLASHECRLVQATVALVLKYGNGATSASSFCLAMKVLAWCTSVLSTATSCWWTELPNWSSLLWRKMRLLWRMLLQLLLVRRQLIAGRRMKASLWLLGLWGRVAKLPDTQADGCFWCRCSPCQRARKRHKAERSHSWATGCKRCVTENGRQSWPQKDPYLLHWQIH